MAAQGTYSSLVLTSLSAPLQPTTRTLPTSAAQGTAIVKVLATHVLPYMKAVQTGKLPYTLALPLVPSANCIARIHAVGPDATDPRLQRTGQLVLADMTVRPRDNPAGVPVLQGLHAGDSTSLMSQWADGSWAEYAIFPLENVFALDEEVLLGQLGYDVEDLCAMLDCLVPLGGLTTLDVKPGETVIVCPATGQFSGAAVVTALAMGARVVAAARNSAKLETLVAPMAGTGRVKTVVMGGEAESDTKKLMEAVGPSGADCYVDFSPPQAANSTHITACLGAVRPKGRVVFNGGCLGDVSIPYIELMLKSLEIHGQYMYEREDVVRLIKMAESGLMLLGKKVSVRTVGKFKLDQFQDALDLAEKESGWGQQVLLMP